MALTPGARLGPCEIIGAIGAGGMGEVYEARDPRLDRMVAVKVLSRRTSRRTRSSARAISQLSHPNICTLHDVGGHEGTAFLVMSRRSRSNAR